MSKRALICAFTLVAACADAGRTSSSPSVTVFAAASLVTSLDAIVEDFETTHEADVVISYAASAHLAQQIIAGADADVFLSASVEWADEVTKARLALRREDTFGNSLVLVAPRSNPAGLATTGDVKSAAVTRVAIGEPESVPAGKYAREAFTTLGLWDTVRAKAVYTMDVRQALVYAEHGEVDAAVVYATDAAASDDVVVIAALDEALQTPVRYSLVHLEAEPRNEAAAEFFEFLFSAQAEARFLDAGFVRLPRSGGER